MREVTKVWVALDHRTAAFTGTTDLVDGPESKRAWKKIVALVADGWDVKATVNLTGVADNSRGYLLILQLETENTTRSGIKPDQLGS